MQKKPLIVLIILLLISILIFFNNNLPPVKFATSAIQNLFESPKAFITDIRTGGEARSSEEIERLRRENAELAKKLLEFENVKRDNIALRSQFEEGPTREYRLLPAKVIGFLGKFSFPTSLIIDKGESDGLKKDMVAISNNKIVGKINKVSADYSELMLIVNPAFAGLARGSENGAPGIVNGAADFILFDRVDIAEKINVGEVVLTKGEINGEGFGAPPDLIIGKISSVNKNESLPHQSAKVESDVQFSKLDTVFVILGI